MNRIDIDGLSEAELIDLNHRVVERLRLLNQIKAHSKMLEFKIGDRVTFDTADGQAVVGVLTRYNKKSVTVISDQGQRWNVAPAFVRPITPVAEATPPTPVVPPALNPKPES